MQGKIIKGIAGFYYVNVVESGVYECKAKGVFRKEKIKPLVGDNVRIEILDEENKTGNIVEIFPRKNELIRPAVANIDQALVVFAARGIPLADADQLSREILLPGSPLLPQLVERFGADIIKEDGTLDRRLLADRAFATPEGKAALDALTHPEIVRRIRAAKQAAQQAGAKLFVLDGAVIIGTAAEAECDKLCVVTAPFEVSVERIAARDGISPEMAARRLNAQTPEAVLTARADYILPNTSTREALAKAANELCDALIGEGCCA